MVVSEGAGRFLGSSYLQGISFMSGHVQSVLSQLIQRLCSQPLLFFALITLSLSVPVKASSLNVVDHFLRVPKVYLRKVEIGHHPIFYTDDRQCLLSLKTDNCLREPLTLVRVDLRNQYISISVEDHIGEFTVWKTRSGQDFIGISVLNPHDDKSINRFLLLKYLNGRYDDITYSVIVPEVILKRYFLFRIANSSISQRMFKGFVYRLPRVGTTIAIYASLDKDYDGFPESSLLLMHIRWSGDGFLPAQPVF